MAPEMPLNKMAAGSTKAQKPRLPFWAKAAMAALALAQSRGVSTAGGDSSSFVMLLLAGGCSRGGLIVDLDREKQIPARRFERLSDKEFLDYMVDCFDLVVAGDRRGEELKAFVHERGKRAGF